jgi:hypothetical protein
MKRIIYFFVAFVFIAACNSNKKDSDLTVTSNDGKEKTKIDLSEAVNTTDDLNKKMEELKKLTPLTTDQLKSLLPEEMLGMKRTNFEAASMGGYSVADATYRKDQNDEAYISVSVVDCAGNSGASYYSAMYWTKMSITKESDDGYTKTVNWNGSRAIESYDKSRDRYEVTYFSGDRYLVTLKGGKTGLDLVKQVADNLRLQ